MRSSGFTPYMLERRKSLPVPFDIVATLELNLDRYPTKSGMLTFLRTLLYTAEAGDLAVRQPAYVEALRRAVDVVSHSPSPTDAAATLQGYQTFMRM